MNYSAEEYRESAARKTRDAAESFERCDTDGFVSQWASGISADLDRAKAALIEAGKVSRFIGLYEGDRRVKAKLISTRFGTSWLLHEDEAELIRARGKPFLPTGRNSRILKSLNLAERWEYAPAWATLGGGSGTGLGGATGVRVIVFRTGDKWGGDAELEES